MPNGLSPNLAQEMRVWLRTKHQELNLLERILDRCEELEWENQSLRDRIDIITKARKDDEQE